jgi:hypothetical protein
MVRLTQLRHGVLIVFAALATLSLTGQEYGRTIPLADIRRELARQPGAIVSEPDAC